MTGEWHIAPGPLLLGLICLAAVVWPLTWLWLAVARAEREDEESKE